MFVTIAVSPGDETQEAEATHHLLGVVLEVEEGRRVCMRAFLHFSLFQITFWFASLYLFQVLAHAASTLYSAYCTRALDMVLMILRLQPYELLISPMMVRFLIVCVLFWCNR